MIHRLKFRAYNKTTGVMIDLEKITPLITGDASPKGVFVPFDDNLVVMQYTGLKDKNGAEIYEGDILKWGGYDSLVGDVYYNTPAAQFVLRLDKDKETETYNPLCKGPMSFGNYGIMADAFEIIGNVHQHCELLTPQQ